MKTILYTIFGIFTTLSIVFMIFTFTAISGYNIFELSKETIKTFGVIFPLAQFVTMLAAYLALDIARGMK
jgi:hypothetical protein